jgi:uncharacterized protein YoaH (UPF0181 family)
MCPFCVATAVWIAAGAVSTGDAAAVVATKFFNKKTRERAEGGSDDKQ